MEQLTNIRRRLFVRDTIFTILTLGLYWAWTVSSYSQFIISPEPAGTLMSTELVLMVSLIVCASVTLSIALFPSFRLLLLGESTLLCICLFASIGSFALAFNGFNYGIVLLLSGIVVGVAEAVLLYRLCKRIDPAMGSQNIIVIFAGMLIVSTAVYILLFIIGGITATIVNACIPAAICAVLYSVLKTSKTKRDYTLPKAAQTIAHATNESKTESKRARLAWQVLFGFSIFGIAFGLSIAMPVSYTDAQPLNYLIHLTARTVSALVVIFLTLKIDNCYWAISVFGIACFSCAFLSAYYPSEDYFVLATGIAATLGYTGFELMMWALIFEIASETSIHFESAYGFGRGAMQFGIAFGSGLTYLVIHASLPPYALNQMLQISIVIMLVVLFGLFSRRNISELWGMEKSVLQISKTDGQGLSKLLAESLRFTQRECDIALFLTKGRSEPFIAESLFLSKSTVHTHIRKMYVKSCVRSRQEFLSLVEELVNERNAWK